MRDYIPPWEKIGISKGRYRELLNFCQQYDEWKWTADSMLGIRGVALDGQPHGSGVGDPVFAAVIKRNTLLAKVDIIERCALSVDSGVWFESLIENVCRRLAYEKIPQSKLPTSNRYAFFQARKKFFLLLNELRDEDLIMGIRQRETEG